MRRDFPIELDNLGEYLYVRDESYFELSEQELERLRNAKEMTSIIQWEKGIEKIVYKLENPDEWIILEIDGNCYADIIEASCDDVIEILLQEKHIRNRRIPEEYFLDRFIEI